MRAPYVFTVQEQWAEFKKCWVEANISNTSAVCNTDISDKCYVDLISQVFGAWSEQDHIRLWNLTWLPLPQVTTKVGKFPSITETYVP